MKCVCKSELELVQSERTFVCVCVCVYVFSIHDNAIT